MAYTENYSRRAQDEVQTAHWKQEQVTLYTSFSWFRDQICSHVIISDSQSHNKSTVVPFTDKLLDEEPDRQNMGRSTTKPIQKPICDGINKHVVKKHSEAILEF